MRALRAAVATAAAAAMGIGLAALPHTENDPCIEHLEEVVGNPHYAFSLFPLGHHCAPGAFVGPSTTMTVVWMAIAGLLVAAALWRPSVALRGAVAAAATLALLGWAYVHVQPFGAVFLMTAVLACPMTAAIARRPGVLLPPLMLAVWVVPYLLGYGHAATVLGIAAGAAVAWALHRLGRWLAPIWRPEPRG